MARSGLPGVAALAETIKTRIQDPTALHFLPAGDRYGWAAQWATDSLEVARTSKAYEVTLTNPRTTGTIVKKLTGEPCSEKRAEDPAVHFSADRHRQVCG